MDFPKVGIGGSVVIPKPYNKYINSFREWDHFHKPISPLPEHRFWTWAKMDRPINTPVGECLTGVFSNIEYMDIIFECDKPIIDEVVKEYPGSWHGIGNEPNFFPKLKPEYYTYQFNKYREYILSIDATAKLMLGGITLPVEWKSWFSEIEIEVDIYDIHPYPVDNTSKSTIDEIIEFKKLVDKPIILGEFSSGNDITYCREMGDWLNRNYKEYNIIAWYWWLGTDLVIGNKLTPLGLTYLQYCTKHNNVFLPVIER